MQNLELITTGQWSNIPVCVVQAINILVELLRTNTNQIDSIKTSLTDLSLKFSVKTGRYDSSIEELNNSFKSLNGRTFKEAKEFNDKQVELKELIESKHKANNDRINEGNNKISGLNSEFRKETRENYNKLEKLKNEVEKMIFENNEVFANMIEKNFKDIRNNIHELTQGIYTVIDENKGKILDFSKSIENLEEKIQSQSILTAKNSKDHENLQNTVKRLKEKYKHHKFSLKGLYMRLDSFTKPLESGSSSPNSGKSPSDSIYINPLIEKLSKLEQKIEDSENKSKKLIEEACHLQTQKIISIKENIEKWTKQEILFSIEKSLVGIKKKIEWLPDDMEKTKGMSITEARIFLLESRIREEENARIISDQKIENSLSRIANNGTKVKNIRKNLTPTENKIVKIEKSNTIKRERPNSSFGFRETGLNKSGLRDRFSFL